MCERGRERESVRATERGNQAQTVVAREGEDVQSARSWGGDRMSLASAAGVVFDPLRHF